MSEFITITIHLLDKAYEMSCRSDERSALEQAARMLNTKMINVRSSGTSLSHERVAIQAAVNLAHELVQLQKDPSLPYLPMQKELDDLIEKIDSQLEPLAKEGRFAR